MAAETTITDEQAKTYIADVLAGLSDKGWGHAAEKARVALIAAGREAEMEAAIEAADERDAAAAQTPRPDRIALAHEIAVKLWDAGIRGPDGCTIMAMALGIYMEAQEGAHRGLRPVSDAMCSIAQQTFDAFQQANARKAGNA